MIRMKLLRNQRKVKRNEIIHPILLQDCHSRKDYNRYGQRQKTSETE